MQLDPLTRLWAVIPAGGAGTRLWPLSRAGRPKFLLDLTGSGRTLLQSTYDRLAPIVDERMLVVTGQSHRGAVAEQLPLRPEAIAAEPSPRDSMAAIGLAAAIVERIDPDGLIGSFAADHVIPATDRAAFEACIREAVAVADTGLLVTVGIEPTSAATGFGYIAPGERLADFPSAVAVQEFVEKPTAEVAAGYVAAGYRWNASMFITRASVLLDLLAEQHPALAAGLRQIAASPDSLDEVWPTLTKIPIDIAVAEPAAAAGRVAMVPGAFGWDDIGDFAALGSMLSGPLAVLGSADQVIGIDATGLVVPAGGRPIAVLGLEDVVVVDTGDAVLVTTRDRAQQVKSVVDALRERGLSGLL